MNAINWENSSWTYLTLVGDEEDISLLHTKVLRIFRSCFMPWKDERTSKIKLCMGKQIDVVQKVHQNKELWTKLMVSQWNSSGVFSQDSPHCSLSVKFKSYCQNWAYNQKISLDGLSSCRCSTTSHGDLKTVRRDANQALSSFLCMQKDFHQENGHSSDLRIQSTKRMGESCGASDDKICDNICRKRTPSFPRHESIIQRSAPVTVKTVFCTIISVNQLSNYRVEWRM